MGWSKGYAFGLSDGTLGLTNFKFEAPQYHPKVLLAWTKCPGFPLDTPLEKFYAKLTTHDVAELDGQPVPPPPYGSERMSIFGDIYVKSPLNLSKTDIYGDVYVCPSALPEDFTNTPNKDMHRGLILQRMDIPEPIKPYRLHFSPQDWITPPL